MKISVMTSTGDDNLINIEEKGDLEYRKAQLKRLQEEVVDIEDMSSGISIMDLGLNEFRLDLLDYIKNNGDLDKTPFGLHAVVPAKDDAPSGVIFVLKNLNGRVNINNQNRLHPFYMVYIADDGEVSVIIFHQRKCWIKCGISARERQCLWLICVVRSIRRPMTAGICTDFLDY